MHRGGPREADARLVRRFRRRRRLLLRLFADEQAEHVFSRCSFRQQPASKVDAITTDATLRSMFEPNVFTAANAHAAGLSRIARDAHCQLLSVDEVTGPPITPQSETSAIRREAVSPSTTPFIELWPTARPQPNRRVLSRSPHRYFRPVAAGLPRERRHAQ